MLQYNKYSYTHIYVHLESAFVPAKNHYKQPNQIAHTHTPKHQDPKNTSNANI